MARSVTLMRATQFAALSAIDGVIMRDVDMMMLSALMPRQLLRY